MSHYVWSSKLDYIDYLQARSFEDDIRREIRSSTDSLAATSERLQQKQISATNANSAELSRQLGGLSTDIQHVGLKIARLNSTFHWGFSEMLMSIGGVAASLEQLVQIAANSSKGWAYEQFRDAREAHRKQLFPEALKRINWAINGFGDHMGYDLEYRFHLCLGIIRLGSFANNGREAVDLVEAKKAFLNAARYSIHDEPQEAANAYVCAGRASFYQQQLDEARAYSEKACQLNPLLPEAFFQLAKILMCQGDVQAGIEQLKTALRLDPGYERVMQADDDFQRYSEPVQALLTTFTRDAKENYEQKLIDFKRDIEALRQMAVRHPGGQISRLEKDALKVLSDAQTLSAAGTYSCYLDAATRIDAGSWKNDKQASCDLQWLVWRMERNAEIRQAKDAGQRDFGS